MAFDIDTVRKKIKSTQANSAEKPKYLPGTIRLENVQTENVPSVKRTEPSDEVKNAVHKSLARISGIPMTGRDDVGIVPYSGNGGKSQGAVSLAPTRKNEFMLANMQKNYVSPEVKNAVEKSFERMGAVKAPTSPYSPYKTGSLDNQIKYAEQEYNARNEEYKDRLRMVRNRYTPEQGKAMLEKNKVINNQKDYRGAIDRADENLENLKNMRYNIDIKNKRTEMEKVVNNEDFERYSADPGGKKEISFFRYIDPRYNAINQPIAYADEKERKIYFYYLEKEGQKKADEYYKTIERELTARRAVQKSKEDEKFGNEHKILASAETIAASIPALKDFNSEVRKYNKNKKNGTYEPMNPDSMNFDATRKQMDLEQGITKDMSGAGRFFTQTGLSMGKSLASSLFGKFGLAIMSGNAAAQSTYEALKNGATSRQALTKGLADGFTEYITEKVPFDNFFKIVKGGNIKGAKALLKNILKQAGAEGSGEVLAEYMNYAIDRYVMGDKSDFNSLVNTYIENGYTANEAEKEAGKQYLIVNPALAFAGGVISGVGMGGVAQTTNYLAGKWQNHIEGKTAENKNAPSRPTENVQGNSSDMGVSSDGGVIFEPPAQKGISENINNTEPMQSVPKNGQIENDIDIDGEGIGNNQTEAEKLAGARLERILKNRFGVETVHFNDENGSKGYYDPKTKKMYINDFYTANRYFTTAHEFFHSYKDIDIEGYNVIKKAVLADLSLEEYNKYKNRQITLRNSNNLDTENIDIDGLVAEEVISDLGAEVLKNPESLEGIFKRFENDKTFIEKFMDYIRGLVRKVREFLNSDYIENDNDIRNLVKNYSEIENIYRSVLESGGTMDYSAEGNDTGVKYSITDANDTEKTGVKQQIKNNSETLGKMEPVYNNNLEVEKKGRMENQEWVMNLFKNYNYEVFREGLGKIIIDRRRIRSSLSYLKTDGDLAAYAALPAVLENGKIIGGHTNHKSRGYETVTIGAPVVINGVRGNMAAVVRIDEHGNYYKIHRILMPNGSSFVYENKISNAETAEADLQNKPVVSPTDVAYNDIVSHTSEDVNTNKIKKLGNVQVNSFNNKRLGTEYQTSDNSVSQSGENVKHKLPTAEEKQDADMQKSAKMRMNEMAKEAKQATDEGLDIEKYYNTPREKRITENAVRAPRLERMEKAAEDFKKTGDSFKLPKKSDYNSYKRDAQRKGIYYNNIETYMKNQLSGARSESEREVIKKALDMFLQKKVAYENDEKARAQKVITSMDEAYKMLDTKRNFKLAEEVIDDIIKNTSHRYISKDTARNGYYYRTHTFYQIMLEAFGEKHYGIVKDLIDDFNDSKGNMSKRIDEKLVSMHKAVVNDLGIKKGSRESAAVMWYGEGEKTPDLTNADDIALLKKMGIKDFKKLDPNIKVKYDGARLEKDFGHEKAERIKKADAYFRKVYDEYIDDLNAQRKRIYPFNPQKQIQKKKNYYRHFEEMTNDFPSFVRSFRNDTEMDAKYRPGQDYSAPNSKKQSIEKRRKGKATAEDAVGGFIDYVTQAEYILNIDDNISAIRSLASDIIDLTRDKGGAEEFTQYLLDFANHLAGKSTSDIEKGLKKLFSKKANKVLQTLNNTKKANSVIGNISTILKQPTNVINGLGVLENPTMIFKGIKDTVEGVTNENIKRRYKESNFLTERFLDKSYSVFEKNSPLKFFSDMLGWADEFGARSVWNAAYDDALKLKKTGKKYDINPARYADDAARAAVAGRGIGEVPLIYKSEIAKLALPFQIEVQNGLHLMYNTLTGKYTSGEYMHKSKVSKRIGKELAMLFAMWAANGAIQAITGSKASLDIIGDIIDGMKQGFKEKDDEDFLDKLLRGTKRSTQNVAGDFASNALFGWVVGEILEIFNEDYSDELFNGNFQSNGINIPAAQSGFKFAKKLLQGDGYGAGAEIVTSFVTPYGGAQIDKTIRGLTDWGKGAKYQNDAYKKVSKFFANRNSSDYEGVDGKKKYDIEKNPLTFAQSALFGPSALGGDYYNDQKTARHIEDEEKAQKAKREEKFRKNYKNDSVIYLAKAQKDNDLIPYDEVKSDFKFTHKKQEYEFTIPKEAKEEYDKMLLDEMEKEYDKVMDKPEYIGALNARKAEILKDAKSKARKTVNAKIKKDYLDGKFGE